MASKLFFLLALSTLWQEISSQICNYNLHRGSDINFNSANGVTLLGIKHVTQPSECLALCCQTDQCNGFSFHRPEAKFVTLYCRLVNCKENCPLIEREKFYAYAVFQENVVSTSMATPTPAITQQHARDSVTAVTQSAIKTPTTATKKIEKENRSTSPKIITPKTPLQLLHMSTQIFTNLSTEHPTIGPNEEDISVFTTTKAFVATNSAPNESMTPVTETTYRTTALLNVATEPETLQITGFLSTDIVAKPTTSLIHKTATSSTKFHKQTQNQNMMMTLAALVPAADQNLNVKPFSFENSTIQSLSQTTSPKSSISSTVPFLGTTFSPNGSLTSMTIRADNVSSFQGAENWVEISIPFRRSFGLLLTLQIFSIIAVLLACYCTLKGRRRNSKNRRNENYFSLDSLLGSSQII